jgi:hypothetical protein
MNKKFEYVDDNPGSYFGMLVESVEDRKELKEKKGDIRKYHGCTIHDEGHVFICTNEKGSNIGQSSTWAGCEGIIDDYVDKKKKDKKDIKKEELKEDKFVPQDKMSKKAQKELNDKKRGTWGGTNPVTRVQPNKKAYDRKRDKKTNLDEAKKGSKVYIAIGLEKGKEPKILGVYDSKEKANEQYKDSKMWVNISEQTVK